MIKNICLASLSNNFFRSDIKRSWPMAPHPAIHAWELYVACSRVGKPGSLKFALKKEKNGNIQKAMNIVFKEVLLNN